MSFEPADIRTESIDITKETIADKVFNHIQNAIIRGDLKPGSKLKELDIGKKLEVSRGPLREAIRRLEERKLVTRTPYAGVRVVSISFKTIEDIFIIRESLESLAAGLAADNMGKQEIDDLEKLLDTHTQNVAKEDGKNYYQPEGYLDFHYRIVMACGNSVLKQIYSSELYHRIRMYRYQLSTKSGRSEKALNEHRNILEAVKNKDAELAEFLMGRHINNARMQLNESDFING